MTALLYGEDVVSGASGYASVTSLVTAQHNGWAARAWALGSRPVCLQLNKTHGGGYWKDMSRFPLTDPTDTLTKCAALGVPHPSSWGALYHKLAPKLPRIRWTLNGMFAFWAGGPWSEALRVGDFKGGWYRYDLISAYRWAAQQGLPDPATYRAVSRRTGDECGGLWVCFLDEPRPDLPSTLTMHGRDRPIVLSSEEIERYDVRVRILRGITWSRTLPATYVDDTLHATKWFSKETGRAYWGRWIARDPLHCWTPGKQWALRNPFAQLALGWVIVGRVRLRVWEASRGAAHVYVDEVVTPYPLETGDQPGDWHLKEIYPRGVTVKRTGHFGHLDGLRHISMATGVRRTPQQHPDPHPGVFQ